MGSSKAARLAALARVELGRKHAALQSHVPYVASKKKGQTMAGKIAEGVGKDPFYVNVLEAVPMLIARLTPGNIKKMVEQNKKGLGSVLPESKYIGPGNKMDLGLPTDDGDALAYLHDEAYDRLLKSGVAPKFVYGGLTQADEDAIRDSHDILSDHPDAGALAVYLGISAKNGASTILTDALKLVPQALQNKLGLGQLKKFYPDPDPGGFVQEKPVNAPKPTPRPTGNKPTPKPAAAPSNNVDIAPERGVIKRPSSTASKASKASKEPITDMGKLARPLASNIPKEDVIMTDSAIPPPLPPRPSTKKRILQEEDGNENVPMEMAYHGES